MCGIGGYHGASEPRGHRSTPSRLLGCILFFPCPLSPPGDAQDRQRGGEAAGRRSGDLRSFLQDLATHLRFWPRAYQKRGLLGSNPDLLNRNLCFKQMPRQFVRPEHSSSVSRLQGIH